MADSDDKMLNEIKGLLYLDGSADDGLLKGYIAAADQFIKNAVGDNQDFYEKANVRPLFENAVKALAATYYQYRLALSDTQTFPIDLTVNSIIGQLRGRYDLEVGDNDETSDQPAQPSN
ncbi:phage head-tail connector protein [Limosilactobacillus sp. c11Ua_112_M]|uniref:head-tail connector protein n=1 Tax=Limosilactobacillus portuensis TaxID=2742601 RepID=UPI0017825A12|nr:head-tail connector protein [Limosilactobacillus portuensis]MBD8087944.1 phage head-tail connector protein [Limosilactobacillus portuensis]